MKRKLVTAGSYNNEVESNKLFIRKNTSAYGDVERPQVGDARAIKNDVSFQIESSDESSAAITGTRTDYANIRLKQSSKWSYSTLLHPSADSAVEWSIGTELDLTLGKREQVLATRGASVSIQDPNAALCGFALTTKGVLNGIAGNYATVVIVNGGSTGTATVDVSSSPDLVINIYNDTTLEDLEDLLTSSALVSITLDSNGDSAVDTVAALMAARNVSAGQKLYFAGGCEKGFLYSNEEAPVYDATAIFNKQKFGHLVTGMIFDKMSLEVGANIPFMKFEGSAKKFVSTGFAPLTRAATAETKLYVGGEIHNFNYDPFAPTCVDTLASDKVTYIDSFNRVVGINKDVNGYYIEVLNPVTAPVGAYVCFTEPVSFAPVFKPMNGQAGTIKLDNKLVKDLRSIKFEYANNHEVMDDLALTDTVGGYSASKKISAKVSFEMVWRRENQELIKKLRQKEVNLIPVEIRVGVDSGKTLVLFLRNVSFAFPNTQDKADGSTIMSLSGDVVITPESSEIPSVVVATV